MFNIGDAQNPKLRQDLADGLIPPEEFASFDHAVRPICDDLGDVLQYGVDYT